MALPGSRIVVGLLAFAAVAQAQKPVADLLKNFDRKREITSEQEQKARDFYESKQLLSKPTDKDRDVLKAKAEQLVYRITQPEFHQVQPEGTELKARPSDKTLNFFFGELRKWQHTPESLTGKNPTTAQLDYIREFGAAVNAAILTVLTDKNPPPMLRIAAMRMLVVACETGAPAHWTTVQSMLKDPKTSPDVLIYAIHAAEVLLAVYEPDRAAWLAPNKGASELIVVDIVQALETIVLKGPGQAVLDKVHAPDDTETNLTTDPKKPAEPGAKLRPEQVSVFQIYRLAAIKALAKLKVETVGGKGGDETVEARPLFTLAKVALADPSIQPPLLTKEIGEAVLGLANVVPAKAVSADDQLYAMAIGFKIFTTPKANNPEDNSAAWKGIASRMKIAFAAYCAKGSENAKSFSKMATDKVLAPILEGGLNRPDVLAIAAWLSERQPPSGELFADKKPYKLTYPK